MNPKFLVDVILCAQLPSSWHHLQENNSQTLWLVQDIQMRQSDCYKIHDAMRQSYWCEKHTTIHANIVIIIIFYKKRKTLFFSLWRHSHPYLRQSWDITCIEDTVMTHTWRTYRRRWQCYCFYKAQRYTWK